MDSKKFLKDLFHQALDYCSPSSAISNSISINENLCRIKDRTFDLNEKSFNILSVGKASAMMFNSANSILGEHINGSLVVTSEEEHASNCQAQETVVASHPTPDGSSLEAGQKVVDFIRQLPENSVLLCLISGGTSSLVCLPAEGISIDELNQTYELLNNSGATIHEINTVRKHCSRIKGGQLLRYMTPSTSLVELVISDVPDDDLSIIGSAPTTPDVSSFQDAYHVLLEFELWEKLPSSVRIHIEKGVDGEVSETLKPGDDPLIQHHSYIISSAKKFAERLATLAKEKNYKVWTDNKAFNNKVEKIADSIAQKSLSFVQNRSPSKDSSPQLLIYYGESYVKVTGSGKGGRNQELALRGALKIDGIPEITWVSVGTDGIDGPTDAAGAIVDGNTIPTARNKGIDPEDFLKRNDSYHFHKQLGTLYKTGPTGNNLMDVTIVAIQ